MRSYPLRAMSVCERYLVPFTLKDGPIPLDDKTFALSNQIGSPILTYGSILRGSDLPDLFAGDIVKSNGNLYQVSYHRGLVGRNLEEPKDILYLSVGNYEIVSNIYNREEDSNKKQTSFPYKYKDNIFYIQDIYGVHGDKLAVNINGGMLMDITDVQQYAGIRDADKKLVFFGDYGIYFEDGQLISNVNGETSNITKGGKF